MKRRPCCPTRSWQYSTGPGESSLIATAIPARRGENAARVAAAPTRSSRSLASRWASVPIRPPVTRDPRREQVPASRVADRHELVVGYPGLGEEPPQIGLGVVV